MEYLKSCSIKSNNDQEVQKPKSDRGEVKFATSPTPTLNRIPPYSSVLKIEQDLIDDSYLQYSPTAPNSDNIYGEYASSTTEQEVNTEASGTEPTMCRNYMQGTCSIGAACIFEHKLILSQLPRDYTFLMNFEYVDDSVTEEDYCQLKVSTQLPLKEISSSDLMDQGADVNVTVTSISGTAKRDWATTLSPNTSTTIERELDEDEPSPKKCKHCDASESIYQYHKDKAKYMIRANEELQEKLADLNGKIRRANIVLNLFRPTLLAYYKSQSKSKL